MSEMLVILLVAIIVIGPKELPGMMRSFGNVMAKIKKMAREFQGQIDDAMRDTELSTSAFQPMEDAKKSMEKIQNAMSNPLDAHKEVISDELTEASAAAEAALGPETAKLKKEIKSKAASAKSAAAKRAAAKKAPPKKQATKKVAEKSTAAKEPAKKPAAKKITAAAKKPAPKRAPAKAKATS